MYATISGIYENGQITFNEPVPTDERVPVMITFLNNDTKMLLEKGEVRLGSLKGKISISDDFNAPIDDLKEYMF